MRRAIELIASGVNHFARADADRLDARDFAAARSGVLADLDLERRHALRLTNEVHDLHSGSAPMLRLISSRRSFGSAFHQSQNAFCG